MAELPVRNVGQEMVDSIYKAIEKEEKRDLYLARIGASSIGDECLRSIWLSWRAYDDKQFGGRMLRLFGTGHWQEARVVEDLRRAGYEVWDYDENNKQFTYTDRTGHFVCKLDGVLKGVPGSEKTPHDLEIKSHNKNSFTELKKKGVEKAKPVHFWQMQAGMLYSKLPRALYVSVCKDDEDYHVEKIYPDETIQAKIQAKITALVEAIIPPLGISEDGKAFGCKWCDMKEVCVEGKTPIRTCRSCVNAVVGETEGNWICGLTGEIRSNSEQKEACEHYEVLKP